MAVTFHFQQPFNLKSRNKLKRLSKQIFSDENKRLDSLNIIFCSDSYLLDINRTYLSHDYFTDIITFDLNEKGDIDGEIYISIDRAKANALRYKVLLTNELTRLVCHGCLHLCGYRDKKKKEKLLMSAKENEYLFQFDTM